MKQLNSSLPDPLGLCVGRECTGLRRLGRGWHVDRLLLLQLSTNREVNKTKGMEKVWGLKLIDEFLRQLVYEEVLLLCCTSTQDALQSHCLPVSQTDREIITALHQLCFKKAKI